MSVKLHTLIIAFVAGLLFSGCTDRNISTSLLRSITAQQKTCASGEYLADAAAGTCAPAGAGYYSPPSSNDRFPCEAGRYCSGDRNTSAQGDGACDGGRFCPAGSTDALGSGLCQAGHACPAGSTTDVGTGACLGGTYAAAGSASCSVCTFNTATYLNATKVDFDLTQTGLTSNSCAVIEISECSTNFVVDADTSNQTCRTRCASGTYWNSSTKVCTDIPKNSYAGNDDATILQCPTNSQTAGPRSTSISECVGDEGYYNCSSGTCSNTRTDGNHSTYSPAGSNALSPCPAGYACSTGVAVACGDGEYSSGAAASCSQCTNPIANSTGVVFNSSSALPSDSCSVQSILGCNSGFVLDSGNLTCRSLCTAGKYWTGSLCQDTPQDYYTLFGTDTKQACPTGSTSSVGSWMGGTRVNGIKACYNKPGYQCSNFNDSSTPAPSCTLTPAGKYAGGNNSFSFGASEVLDCTAGYDCPAGSTSATGVGICGPGTYSTTGTPCQACTNKPIHADSFSYDWDTGPTTTATSCPINVVNSCDQGWQPNSNQKACETSNPCWQTAAATPGTSCGDGTYYVGQLPRDAKKFRLMIAPRACSVTGGVTACNAYPSDQTTFQFRQGGTGVALTTTGDNGAVNTTTITSQGLDYKAAHMCSDLSWGTAPGGAYTDWFLPANDQFVMISNLSSSYRTTLGFSVGAYYWTSTTISPTHVYNYEISPSGTAFDSPLPINQTSVALVRCMREVEVE